LLFSRDGKRLTSGCQEMTCRWEVAGAKELERRSLVRPEGEDVRGRSDDGGRILVRRKGAAWVLDGTSGKEVCRLQGQHGDISSVFFSPTGDKVLVMATANWEGFDWYDTASGMRLGGSAEARPLLGGPAFSPDGRYLAWMEPNHTVAFADAATGR